ncbi:MAG: hypothetical protein WBN17_07295 [Aureibaculum sp.]
MNTNTENHKNPEKQHKELLGMDVPKDYFKLSKSNIMEKISNPEKKKPRVFYLKPVFRYAIAASVIVLIALGIALKYTNTTQDFNQTQQIENLASADDQDLLINSLFISDKNINTFLDTYLVSNVMEKAELKEQEFDNIFLNSIIETDSLIDSYIDESFIDNIIL